MGKWANTDRENDDDGAQQYKSRAVEQSKRTEERDI